MSKSKSRRRVQWAVLIAGVILLVINLFFLNNEQLFTEPLSKENVGAGFRIISNIFIIAAMVVSLRSTAKEGKK